MGLAAAGTVAVAVLVAITLTPAMLSLIGRRIISRRAWAKADAHNAEPGHEAADEAKDRENAAPAAGAAWSPGTPRWPSWPACSSWASSRCRPPSCSWHCPTAAPNLWIREAYQAYDLTARSFGEGITGPIVAVGEFPAGPG